MTSTETYTAAAGQTRKATANTLQAWTNGAKTFTDQVGVVTSLPKIDLLQPVKSYFQLVQQTIELNKALASTWTGLFTSLSGSVGEHTDKVVHAVADQAEAVVDQAETVVDLAAKQAEKAEKAAKEQTEAAEEAAKEQARLARQAERAAAKEAEAKAREPYEGLPKAELSEQLAARGLPKTGNIEQLIERLVSADSQ